MKIRICYAIIIGSKSNDIRKQRNTVTLPTRISKAKQNMVLLEWCVQAGKTGRYLRVSSDVSHTLIAFVTGRGGSLVGDRGRECQKISPTPSRNKRSLAVENFQNLQEPLG